MTRPVHAADVTRCLVSGLPTSTELGQRARHPTRHRRVRSRSAKTTETDAAWRGQGPALSEHRGIVGSEEGAICTTRKRSSNSKIESIGASIKPCPQTEHASDTSLVDGAGNPLVEHRGANDHPGGHQPRRQLSGKGLSARTG